MKFDVDVLAYWYRPALLSLLLVSISAAALPKIDPFFERMFAGHKLRSHYFPTAVTSDYVSPTELRALGELRVTSEGLDLAHRFIDLVNRNCQICGDNKWIRQARAVNAFANRLVEQRRLLVLLARFHLPASATCFPPMPFNDLNRPYLMLLNEGAPTAVLTELERQMTDARIPNWRKAAISRMPRDPGVRAERIVAGLSMHELSHMYLADQYSPELEAQGYSADSEIHWTLLTLGGGDPEEGFAYSVQGSWIGYKSRETRRFARWAKGLNLYQHPFTRGSRLADARGFIRKFGPEDHLVFRTHLKP